MTYTAEQLLDMVSLIEEQGVPTNGQQIKMLRAHADALEENARLKEQMSDLHTGYTTTLKELTADRDSWMGQANMHSETAHKQMQRAEAKLALLHQHAEAIKDEFYLSWAGDVSREEFNEWPAIAAYLEDFPKEEL